MQLRTLTPSLGLAMTIAAAGASFTTLTAAAADGFTLKDKPKIAMLYFGPKNDGGWTQAFDEARVKIEKEIGQKIQFVENVPEDASAIKPAAEKFIQRGAVVLGGRVRIPAMKVVEPDDIGVLEAAVAIRCLGGLGYQAAGIARPDMRRKRGEERLSRLRARRAFGEESPQDD